MNRKRISILAGAAVLAGAGAGTGAALAAAGSAGQPGGAPAAVSSGYSAPGYSAPGYSWYQSMMNGYYGGSGGMGGMGGGGMMGGSPSAWMMSRAGYQWMLGGSSAPGWMRGGTAPAGAPSGITGADPGTVMGRLFAAAPGPRVSAAAAQRLGGQVPAGATVDRAARTITFTTANVHLVVLASPSMPAESFRIAGMTDPAISVPARAHVSIELINADSDMAHGLVITAAGAASSAMPMMTAGPAFSGSALWFLGESTGAGMHAGTLGFTATAPGGYQYLCPVPGHAEEGMAGSFTVR